MFFTSHIWSYLLNVNRFLYEFTISQIDDIDIKSKGRLIHRYAVLELQSVPSIIMKSIQLTRLTRMTSCHTKVITISVRI